MFWVLVVDKSPVTGGRSSQWFRGMRFWRYFSEYYPASYVFALTSFYIDTPHPLTRIWVLFPTDSSRNKISHLIDRMFLDIILTVSPNSVCLDIWVTDSELHSTRYNWDVSNDSETWVLNLNAQPSCKGCFGNFRHRRFVSPSLPYV